MERRRGQHRTLRILSLQALTLLWGCFGTPQPDPPNLDPSLIEVSIDRGDEFNLVGRAGSVTPSGATVHIVNLDSEDPPLLVESLENGGFTAIVQGEIDDELRFQATSGHQRSTPIDFVIVPGGIREVERPLANCLLTSPAYELPAPTFGTVILSVINDCEQLVAISNVVPRIEGSGLSVTSAPLEIAPGAEGEIEIALDPPWSSESEEILLIEISSPEETRRAVTLFAQD